MLINRYSPTYRNTTMPKNTPTRKKTTAPYSIVERCLRIFVYSNKKINVAEYKKKTKNETEVYTDKIGILNTTVRQLNM